MKWSKSHHGLTHLYLGEFSSTKTWVSIQDYTGMACLKIYFPRCQFTPELKWFTSVEKAKRAGERVMRRVSA